MANIRFSKDFSIVEPQRTHYLLVSDEKADQLGKITIDNLNNVIGLPIRRLTGGGDIILSPKECVMCEVSEDVNIRFADDYSKGYNGNTTHQIVMLSVAMGQFKISFPKECVFPNGKRTEEITAGQWKIEIINNFVSCVIYR